MKRLFLTSLSIFAISGSMAHAANWTLTTADFNSQQVDVTSIDASGVHIGAGAGERLIPFAQFLDLSRANAGTQAAGQFALHLVSGDTLGGEPVAIKGNDLIWNNSILGEIAIPMKQLVAMGHAGSAIPETRGHEDVVTLGNGDSVHGIVTEFAAGHVTVHAEGTNTDLPVSSIKEILFAMAAGSGAPVNGFRVRLDDGSSVVATSVKTTADKIDMVLQKESTRSVALSHVSMIEQVNGPVSWLSFRPPTENVYIPFLGVPKLNAAKMNRNWSGLDPIRFGAQEFAHGIGVHSYSRLSWDLDGTYSTFRTQYAIDTKDANTQADVTVRILLDGKPVYEKTHVRAGTLSPVVSQDLAGAKKLTLEVDYGDNMDTQDRMNWIEPAILKQSSK